MHGAVTQRSSSGLGAAAISRTGDASIRTSYTAFKDHASIQKLTGRHAKNIELGKVTNESEYAKFQNLSFQRRQTDKFIPSSQGAGNARLFIVTASGSGKYVAPLQPESPIGQFLVEVLHSHPHLFSAAVEQQLDKLAEDRNAAEGEEHAGTGDLVLFKRIADLRARERRTAVEEVIYTLVSQRFLEARISMVPKIPSLLGMQKLDIWPVQDQELLSVHSSEALEMVWEHLAFILGVRGVSEALDESIIVQIRKLHVGHVYAASIIYGYFIKRVDEKFQMEKVLAPKLSEPKKKGQHRKGLDSIHNDASTAEMLATIFAMLGVGDLKTVSEDQSSHLLRDYVLLFEADTLDRSARIRSTESACVIERHTAALFGKPESLDTGVFIKREQLLMVSLAGLKRLYLEAVAFGSFLWDAETFVDSRYPIVAPEVH